MRAKILFLALTAAAVALTSCGPNKPDDKIYATDSVPAGYQVTTPDKDPTPVFQEIVYLAPTWGQANYFASKTPSFIPLQILGSIALLLALAIIFALATDRITFSTGWGWLVFLLLAGSLASFKGTSASIKWNNKKGIPRETYDRAILETGSTAPIWDSLLNNGLINWGPQKSSK